MQLTVTTFTVLALIPVWFVLWMGVSAGRTAHNTSIGDAGSSALLLRIRRHGNFIEWVPFVLVLMILAEVQGAPVTWLYAAGGLLLLAALPIPSASRSTMPATRCAMSATARTSWRPSSCWWRSSASPPVSDPRNLRTATRSHQHKDPRPCSICF